MTSSFPFNRDGVVETRTMIHPKSHERLYLPYGRNETLTQLDDGMYSRSEITPDFLKGIEALALGDSSALGIEDWQLWGQHAWKKEHGTIEAAERFGDKLVEESVEFQEALLTYLNHPSEETRLHAISEAGDVLWSLSAGASNTGVSIEYALQERLLRTAKGTLAHGHNGWEYPLWRDEAIRIAMSNLDPVTVADIDALMAQGFIPEASPVMNIDQVSLDPEEAEEAFTDWSIAVNYSHVLGYHLTQALSGSIHYPYEKARIEIAEATAYLWLKTVYTLKAVTGATLAEAWPVNYTKITERVAQGLVDHEDGERPADLQ